MEDLSKLREERLATLRHWQTLFDRTGDPRQRDFSAPPAHPPAAHASPGRPQQSARAASAV
jgi:NAD-dependent oxidoreductase involved in siderophore biosynthesis